MATTRRRRSRPDDARLRGDPAALELRAPAARYHGVLCVRISDFTHHKNEIVHRVLPSEGRIVVTAYGFPDFEIENPAISDWRRRPPHQNADGVDFGEDGRATVPVSYFMGRPSRYVVGVLPDLDQSIVVTRYGWPDFVVSQIRWAATTRIRYESPVQVPDPEKIWGSTDEPRNVRGPDD